MNTNLMSVVLNNLDDISLLKVCRNTFLIMFILRIIDNREEENACNLIASGSDDNTIKLWDSTTGTWTKTLTGHTGIVCSLVKLNENLIASGSDDKTIKLWDIKTGTCTKTLTGHTGLFIL